MPAAVSVPFTRASILRAGGAPRFFGRRRFALDHLGLDRRFGGVFHGGGGFVGGCRAFRAGCAARLRGGRLRGSAGVGAARRRRRSGYRLARRHLRSQRQRIEIGELRFQVVGGIRVVLERAGQIDAAFARCDAHIVEAHARGIERHLALGAQRRFRVGEIEREALHVVVQTHADGAGKLCGPHRCLQRVQVEVGDLQIELAALAAQCAAAGEGGVLHEPHVQVRDALRLRRRAARPRWRR